MAYTAAANINSDISRLGYVIFLEKVFREEMHKVVEIGVSNDRRLSGVKRFDYDLSKKGESRQTVHEVV